MKNTVTLAVTVTLALIGGGFAALVSARSTRLPAPTIASPEPAAATGAVYGVAVVEPFDEVARIAPAAAGVVATVAVAVGQEVRAGELLVALDEREARARLASAEADAASAAALAESRGAELQVARARLERVAAPPRAEEVAPAAEAVCVAQAEAAEARERLARVKKLTREVAAADIAERQHQADAAEARAAQAAAEAARLAAPGWSRDVAIAEAEVRAATSATAAAEAAATAAAAAVEVARVALADRSVRAARAGRVLRVDVHPGEWVTPGGAPLLELADCSRLRLTAEIDALDAWRASEADAVAWRRGDPSRTWTARALLIEPQARARHEASGAPGEIVDTRVRRLRYALDVPADLLPGEQLELRVDADRRPAPVARAEGGAR